ncbi:MAG: dual OB domain-containing protein [Terracidiphilus sp.]
MRELRFLCLASSKREGGRCVAGIDLGSGDWVRPVWRVGHGALAECNVRVRDRNTNSLRAMKPLDVVSMRVDEHVGNQGQPENWTLVATHEGQPHALLSQGLEDSSFFPRIRALAQECAQAGLIFGSDSNSISHCVIMQRPLSSSLCIVRPDYLRWQRSANYRGNACIDGYFDLGRKRTRHVLRLTDIDWENRLLHLTKSDAEIEHSDLQEGFGGSETYLTISLGDVFVQTGSHYKLIAGVVVLPEK